MNLQNLTNEEKWAFLFNIWKYIESKGFNDLSLSFSEYYNFKNTYAISKAELSELTEEEALVIFHKNYTRYLLDENSERFINDFRREHHTITTSTLWYNQYRNLITKLHDKLEYNNIVNAMKYINIENNPDLRDYVLNHGITKELLIKLHNILTYGMDDLFLDKGIAYYSPYFSGKIRKEDNINVGWRAVWLAKDIEDKIETIRQKSLNIKNIFDVFEIHGIMYEAHIFNNGNKRISRIIELLLINIYNFAPSIPVSYGYYIYNDFYINNLVNLVIEKKDFKSWANFAYATALLSSLDMLFHMAQWIMHEFLAENKLDHLSNWIPKKQDFLLPELEKLLKKAKWVYLTSNEVLEALNKANVLEVTEYYDKENDKTKDLYVVKYDTGSKGYNEVITTYEDVFKLICSYSIHFANVNTKYVINQKLKEYKKNIERGLL